VYRKWNERLFHESYKAFYEGRAEKDPSTGWYQGELSFFDNYVVPLANKLKDCGVFGVSGDELLNFAEQNRKEWEEKGQAIVEEMKELYRADIASELMQRREGVPEPPGMLSFRISDQLAGPDSLYLTKDWSSTRDVLSIKPYAKGHACNDEDDSEEDIF
jgi:hypothetical protein